MQYCQIIGDVQAQTHEGIQMVYVKFELKLSLSLSWS